MSNSLLRSDVEKHKLETVYASEGIRSAHGVIPALTGWMLPHLVRGIFKNLVLFQPVRFLLGGTIAAVIAVTVYTIGAGIFHFPPLVSNTLAYGAQLVVSYDAHRSFSFRYGHADRRSVLRYAGLSLSAFALNSLWVWILTAKAGMPVFAPLIPMILVTPVITYAGSRYWAFRTAAKA